jgi:hypothetical protein
MQSYFQNEFNLLKINYINNVTTSEVARVKHAELIQYCVMLIIELVMLLYAYLQTSPTLSRGHPTPPPLSPKDTQSKNILVDCV